MNDMFLKQGIIPSHEMPHKSERLSLTESVILAILIEIVFKISILTILQHNIDVLPSAKVLIQLDDEW
jgi:hypothetical protein